MGSKGIQVRGARMAKRPAQGNPWPVSRNPYAKQLEKIL
jgi:hypothetical protein